MVRGTSKSASPSTSSHRMPERFEATMEKQASRVKGGQKAAATRGQNVHNDDESQHLEESDIPTTDRHGGDLLGPDFKSGTNPTRSQASHRVAQNRGHNAFVEMGKKGGHSNKGVHAGQINGLDYDDYETYLTHPEVGVPEKSPARVEAGRKAARTRGLHVKDDDQDNENNEHDDNEEYEDEDENYPKQRGRTSNGVGSRGADKVHGKNMNRVRGGKQAARTRGQHVHDDEEDDDEEDDSSESHHDSDYHGKNKNRVEAGKKAASQRSHEDFVKMGKMGAAARWGKDSLHNNDNENDDNDDEDENNYSTSSRSHEGKNPNRVEGGKRAASHRSHEDFVEMGKKGGRARAEKSGQNLHAGQSGYGGRRRSEQDDDDDDENEDEEMEMSDGNSGHQNINQQYAAQGKKNPNRVRGGKQAARTRGDHVDGEEESDFSGAQNRGHQSKLNSTPRRRAQNNQPDDEDPADSTYRDSRADRESIYTHAGFPLSMSATRQDGKQATRIRGGQQAAIARGFNVERGEEEMSNKNPNRVQGGLRAASQRSHEDFVEMGKKGGRAKGNQYQHDDDQDEEMGEEDYHDSDYQGKNRNRVEGGKKAASQRSHEDFVKMGTMGAAARWGKDSLHDDSEKERYDYGEQSAKEQGNYRSKREADTQITSPAKHFRANYGRAY